MFCIDGNSNWSLLIYHEIRIYNYGAYPVIYHLFHAPINSRSSDYI